MRSPCTSRMRDEANPPISAWRTLAGSAPAFEANSSASPTASMVSATMIWLATLQVWPSPLPPTSVMFLPMSWKSGSTFANVASVPPTMIVSVAALAPTSPPETGASRYSQPSALMRLANSFVSMGAMELMSTTILPLASPSATPPGAKSTFSTSGVSGTMMMITSALRATSAELAQTFAPPLTRASGTGPMVKTYSSWPPACRWPAMGAPMIPNPMKPILLTGISLSRGSLSGPCRAACCRISSPG